MKKLLLLFLLSAAAIVCAQTPSLQKSLPLTEAKPKEAGVSPDRLARIDQMCKDAIANNEVPGIVALVARKGKIVFHEAYGMADNESNRKMKKDDIFRIASQSKAITSTAVMMLWEEGKFRLDDPHAPISPWPARHRSHRLWHDGDELAAVSDPEWHSRRHLGGARRRRRL